MNSDIVIKIRIGLHADPDPRREAPSNTAWLKPVSPITMGQNLDKNSEKNVLQHNVKNNFPFLSPIVAICLLNPTLRGFPDIQIRNAVVRAQAGKFCPECLIHQAIGRCQK